MSTTMSLGFSWVSCMTDSVILLSSFVIVVFMPDLYQYSSYMKFDGVECLSWTKPLFLPMQSLNGTLGLRGGSSLLRKSDAYNSPKSNSSISSLLSILHVFRV